MRHIGLITVIWMMGAYGMIAQADPIGPRLAVRNFLEIPAFLSRATGVSSGDAEIKSFLQLAQGGFPQKREVNEFGASLSSLIALSGLYCKRMVEKDASFTGPSFMRRRTHKDIDFGKGPSLHSEASVLSVIEDETGFFWGRSPSSQELDQFRDYMAEAKKHLPNDRDGSIRFFTSLCLAAAASLDSWVY